MAILRNFIKYKLVEAGAEIEAGVKPRILWNAKNGIKIDFYCESFYFEIKLMLLKVSPKTHLEMLVMELLANSKPHSTHTNTAKHYA